MAKTITAADRSALIRLASTMEKGSQERRAILAGVRQASLRELMIEEWRWSAPYPKVEVKTWEGGNPLLRHSQTTPSKPASPTGAVGGTPHGRGDGD